MGVDWSGRYMLTSSQVKPWFERRFSSRRLTTGRSADIHRSIHLKSAAIEARSATHTNHYIKHRRHKNLIQCCVCLLFYVMLECCSHSGIGYYCSGHLAMEIIHAINCRGDDGMILQGYAFPEYFRSCFLILILYVFP